MRKLAALLAMALIALAAPMAALAHTANISWTNSTDTSNTNVYRLAGACPTGTLTGFAKLNASPVTTGSYVDSTVVPGPYCYYVTATLNGVESVPSGTVAAVVPVAPPSGLTLTSVAKTILPDGTQQVLAKWSDDTPGVGQIFTFSDGSKFLNQGFTSSQTGTFAEVYKGPAIAKTVFTVCNTAGACVTGSV